MMEVLEEERERTTDTLGGKARLGVQSRGWTIRSCWQ